MNNIQHNLSKQIHNDEINLKEVFHTVGSYKYSIVLITFLAVVLSAAFAYMKPNIYSSHMTIELSDNKKSASQDLIYESLMGDGGANIDNELAVIKSRFISRRINDILNLNTRYFSSNGIKSKEIYKNSPFVANIIHIEDDFIGKKFIIKPINEKNFQLILEPMSNFGIKKIKTILGLYNPTISDTFNYSEIHNYGETIETEFFTIVVTKITKMDQKKYIFSYNSNNSIYNMIQHNISASQISRKATIVKVTSEDTVALRAQEILNTLFSVYKNQEIEQKSQVAKLTLSFIDQQLDSINKRLKKSAKSLEEFKEKNIVLDLGEQAVSTSEQLTKYEASLQEIEIEENILTNLQQYIKKHRDLSGLTVGSVNFADPILGNLVVKLQQLSAKRSNMLIDFTERHPEVQKLNKTILTLRSTIKDTLKSNIRQIKDRKNSVKKVIAKYKKSLEVIPKQERELTRLSRFFTVNEKIYSYLLEKRAETAITESSTVSNSRLLDEALYPELPIKPKKPLIVVVGFILGLILGLAYAFLREFMTNTIKNSEDIEKLTSLPIYGVIPILNKKTEGIILEAYRTIRTNLQFLPNSKGHNVINITSSVSGEGKTTTGANIAKVIGQAKKKTIVLDLDLRKSSVHKEFNIPNNIGMSNFLSGQNNLEEVIKKTDNEFVDIITTGALPPNPSELLLSDEMKNLIETLRQKYEYVILDTPPVGLVTDAAILMNYADISFLVTRADYTRKEFVKNLDRLAKDYHNNHVGIILNGVGIGGKYGYGYGASYGYGYGNDKYYRNR